MDYLPITNEIDLKAIELKYIGLSYSKIAKAVGVQPSTVKSWFMRSGRLYGAYSEYALAETSERRGKAREIMATNMEKAAKTIGKLLESGDERIQLLACKEALRTSAEKEDEPAPQNETLRMIDTMEALKILRQRAGITGDESVFDEEGNIKCHTQQLQTN